MGTLLLRLAAPMQAWGDNSKFEIRSTGREPTKSGVIGILAAALGRKRTDSLEDLCKLRLGIRVDNEGVLLRDFHSAHRSEFWRTKQNRDAYISTRYYLCDAVFLVGLESDDEDFLKEIEYALCHPAFPLYLGRRSCPPTLPLTLGMRDDGLEAVLDKEPWLYCVADRRKSGNKNIRIICDGSSSDSLAAKRRDVPVSFSPMHREHSYRTVKESYIEKRAAEHDPMTELE